MLCEYCDIGDYLGMCSCTISSSQCPFMRRCSIERKWLPLDGMDVCTLRESRKVEVMLGANEYKVQFERNGKLYIEYNDYVIKMRNPFDVIPEKVELIQVENELYIKGFEPKVEKKPEPKKTKKSTKKKEK